ncbi:MAG: hypothetical protein WCE48_01670, partial [Steroidobacteraceae bacterium]
MTADQDDRDAGVEALERGDARAARDYFARLLAAGKADSTVLLSLAYACSLLQDDAGKLAVLDRLLQLEPGNVRALVLKGDHFAARGDARAA